MVQISEVKGNSRENRTAAHTHIKGLGLESNGYAERSSGGFVGQAQAREVSLEPSWGEVFLGRGKLIYWALAKRHAVSLSISLDPRRCLDERYFSLVDREQGKQRWR